MRILATTLGIIGGLGELLLAVLLWSFSEGAYLIWQEFSIAWAWTHLIAALPGFVGVALSIKKPALGGNIMFGSGVALLFFWAIFFSTTDLLGAPLEVFLFTSSGAILLLVSGGMTVSSTKARPEVFDGRR